MREKVRLQSLADVTLLVVAGGSSRRMGEDKRWLDVGGVPLLEGLLQKAVAAGFAEIFLCVEERSERLQALASRYGARILVDETAGQGPVAGLSRGLAASSHTWAFAVSADMPFFSFDAARELLPKAESMVRAVVPVAEGRCEPLAALYHKETAHVFSAAMAAGERSLRRAAAALPVLEVPVCAGACFFNVNTPAALRLARGRAANLVRRVPLVSIVAPASGTGKTTFVEKLLPLLTSRGVRVGVVKSDAHGIVLNDGTKDSGRFRAAGASSVAVVAPAGFWLYERTQEKLSLEVAAARMTDVDLVLIETRSHGVFPALSLWRELEEPLLDERVAALFSSCHERQAEGILQLDLEAMEDAAHLVLFLMGREEGFDLRRIAWDGGHSGKGGA